MRSLLGIISRPWPEKVELKTAAAAEQCEARGQHDWQLSEGGDLAPHYWCHCWGRAEIEDPAPGRETIPYRLWENYAARWASEGCDFCQTMRDSCRNVRDHFSGDVIERRRKAILAGKKTP